MKAEFPIRLYPDGIERSFSFSGSLQPNGTGVLLDRQVVVAAFKSGRRRIVLILADPSLTIVRTELLEADGHREDFPTRDGLSRYRVLMSPDEEQSVRVGEQYLMTFTNSYNRIGYSVESTYPIRHQEIDEDRKRFNQQLKNILWPQRTSPRPILDLGHKNAPYVGRR